MFVSVWLQADANTTLLGNLLNQFSVPQIEYPIGGSSKKGSHVYFRLQVFWVVLLFDINVVLMLPWWPDVTIVQSDITIVIPWQLLAASTHDYLFGYCSLVGILFEVLRICSYFVLYFSVCRFNMLQSIDP